MIRISKIDDDLSIYKNCRVIIVSEIIDGNLEKLLELMEYHNIEISLIYTMKVMTVKDYKGISVLPFNYLNEFVKKSQTKLVIQLLFEAKPDSLESILAEENVNTFITFSEAKQMLNLYKKFDIMKKSSKYLEYSDTCRCFDVEAGRFILSQYTYNSTNTGVLIVCSPPKTGNKTIETTLEKNGISVHNMQHYPRSFNKTFFANLPYKTKIVTAVREPISQNLSCAYQLLLDSDITFFRWFVGLMKEQVFEDGGDANKLLEIFDKYYGETEFNNHPEFYGAYSIATYYNAFKDFIVDLSKYPFDKEKGYTIVKEGNLEIFVYQLEKLNDIATEFSDWVGETEFTEWNVTNEAEEKWIANSYNQTKNEIEFTRDYFDRCFNEPWVNHFYSQEDIAKFKSKWETHIKD